MSKFAILFLILFSPFVHQLPASNPLADITGQPSTLTIPTSQAEARLFERKKQISFGVAKSDLVDATRASVLLLSRRLGSTETKKISRPKWGSPDFITLELQENGARFQFSVDYVSIDDAYWEVNVVAEDSGGSSTLSIQSRLFTDRSYSTATRTEDAHPDYSEYLGYAEFILTDFLENEARVAALQALYRELGRPESVSEMYAGLGRKSGKPVKYMTKEEVSDVFGSPLRVAPDDLGIHSWFYPTSDPRQHLRVRFIGDYVIDHPVAVAAGDNQPREIHD